MTSLSKVLTLENPVYCGYLTYSSVLVLKMMLMALLTGRQKAKHGVITSPEDAVFFKEKRVIRSHHESVERVKRAHLNDLENIPIFFVAGFTYMLTDPDPETALMLFRIYTAARCAHTFVYAMVVIPQPARAITWGTGFLTTGYMAVPASSEDAVAMKGKTITETHEDVERVKRAHMNDLENIPIFFLASFAYILSNPNPTVAINLFRVYTVARFAHTFVYAIYVVRQPARSTCFFIGFLITGYMAIYAISHFVTF